MIVGYVLCWHLQSTLLHRNRRRFFPHTIRRNLYYRGLQWVSIRVNEFFSSNFPVYFRINRWSRILNFIQNPCRCKTLNEAWEWFFFCENCSIYGNNSTTLASTCWYGYDTSWLKLSRFLYQRLSHWKSIEETSDRILEPQVSQQQNK